MVLVLAFFSGFFFYAQFIDETPSGAVQQSE